MKIKRLGVFPNLGKDNVRSALGEFVKLCRSIGLEPVLPAKIAADYDCAAYNVENAADLKTLDAAVSLGGDGTLLQMARYLSPLGLPAFGVNFGKLGFLAEIDLAGINKAMGKLAAGIFTLEDRSMLYAQVMQNDKCIASCHALNDLVLAKGAFSKMAHLEMYINGKMSGRYAAEGFFVDIGRGSCCY